MYRRDPDPDEPEERTFAVLHAGTFPLPRDRGDYGSGAVDVMGPDDVFVSLLEQGPDAVGTRLYRRKGLPRRQQRDHRDCTGQPQAGSALAQTET